MIFFGVFFVVILIVVFSMISANQRASKIPTSTTPKEVQVTVNKGASQVKPNRAITNTDNDSSPEALRSNVKEEEDKQEAKENGNSHVDTAKELESKARLIREQAEKEKASIEVPVVVVNKKPPTAKAKPQAPVITDEQRMAMNMAKLMKLDSYYPPEPNVTANVNRFVALTSEFVEPIEITGGVLTKQNIYYQDKVIKRDLALKEKEANERKLASDKAIAGGADIADANDPTKVRVYNMGDLILGEIKRPVNSDFNVDVYIDVAEPPLIGMRVKANFEITAAEDGVILRAVELQYKDHVQSLEGYAVDIYTDSSPLFDNDVDSHFIKKFLARASFAFVAPFVDFLGNTTTTVIDGSVVVEKSRLNSTADKVIAGMAGVAGEFLPDLKKNANIPPTVKIPANYPAGIIISKPLYLPIGLFDEDETTNPDQSFKTIITNNKENIYGR